MKFKKSFISLAVMTAVVSSSYLNAMQRLSGRVANPTVQKFGRGFSSTAADYYSGVVGYSPKFSGARNVNTQNYFNTKNYFSSKKLLNDSAVKNPAANPASKAGEAAQGATNKAAQEAAETIIPDMSGSASSNFYGGTNYKWLGAGAATLAGTGLVADNYRQRLLLSNERIQARNDAKESLDAYESKLMSDPRGGGVAKETEVESLKKLYTRWINKLTPSELRDEFRKDNEKQLQLEKTLLAKKDHDEIKRLSKKGGEEDSKALVAQIVKAHDEMKEVINKNDQILKNLDSATPEYLKDRLLKFKEGFYRRKVGIKDDETSTISHLVSSGTSLGKGLFSGFSSAADYFNSSKNQGVQEYQLSKSALPTEPLNADSDREWSKYFQN